jgi:hypothetical protein
VSRLVEFPLEGGGSVVVEVAESELPEGPVRAARPGEIAAKATQSFEAALAKVRPAAEGIIANLPRSVCRQPKSRWNSVSGSVLAQGLSSLRQVVRPTTGST